jgi:hypothetical protein
VEFVLDYLDPRLFHPDEFSLVEGALSFAASQKYLARVELFPWVLGLPRRRTIFILFSLKKI